MRCFRYDVALPKANGVPRRLSLRRSAFSLWTAYSLTGVRAAAVPGRIRHCAIPPAALGGADTRGWRRRDLLRATKNFSAKPQRQAICPKFVSVLPAQRRTARAAIRRVAYRLP